MGELRKRWDIAAVVVVFLLAAGAERLESFAPLLDEARAGHQADLERIFGVEVCHVMVFDIDGRHTVHRCRNQPAIIKTKLQRAGCDLAVPVQISVAQPQVPLADNAGIVAGILQD